MSSRKSKSKSKDPPSLSAREFHGGTLRRTWGGVCRSSSEVQSTAGAWLSDVLSKTFLPEGFPATVSSDYLSEAMRRRPRMAANQLHGSSAFRLSAVGHGSGRQQLREGNAVESGCHDRNRSWKRGASFARESPLATAIATSVSKLMPLRRLRRRMGRCSSLLYVISRACWGDSSLLTSRCFDCRGWDVIAINMLTEFAETREQVSTAALSSGDCLRTS